MTLLEQIYCKRGQGKIFFPMMLKTCNYYNSGLINVFTEETREQEKCFFFLQLESHQHVLIPGVCNIDLNIRNAPTWAACSKGLSPWLFSISSSLLNSLGCKRDRRNSSVATILVSLLGCNRDVATRT